ncbi:MAG: 50S ribosomal protein L23 [Patescibacteria group bacterium]|nr:50S ribosomal protein L23 [Patescibacteria group bacterium]MDE2116781.1 50S ribosomal protein L23 [Patescibacteria group bacterium]
MSLFGKKPKINDSSAEKAEATKTALAKSSQKVVDTKKVLKTGSSAKVTKTGAVDKAEKRAAAAAGVVFAKNSVIIRPRVTEKAGLLSEKGIYTFDVRKDANTREITAAIVASYKVTPVKVSVLPVKAKSMVVRGKTGSTSAGKKAYVNLKKGDTIEFI